MKLLKGTILVLALVAFTNVNAQDDKLDKAEKKMKLMDTNNDKSVSLDEMNAFFEGKKNKKGHAISGNDMFIGWDDNDDGKVTVDELMKKVNRKKINAKKKGK